MNFSNYSCGCVFLVRVASQINSFYSDSPSWQAINPFRCASLEFLAENFQARFIAVRAERELRKVAPVIEVVTCRGGMEKTKVKRSNKGRNCRDDPEKDERDAAIKYV